MSVEYVSCTLLSGLKRWTDAGPEQALPFRVEVWDQTREQPNHACLGHSRKKGGAHGGAHSENAARRKAIRGRDPDAQAPP